MMLIKMCIILMIYNLRYSIEKQYLKKNDVHKTLSDYLRSCLQY